jgi:uncharacterized Tic20 family protein
MNKMMKNVLELKVKVSEILLDKKGEGAINVAITILVSIILGALILAGLYALIGDVILPELQNKIMEMFNFEG